MIKLTNILKQVLQEEKTKRDRCLRIADRKFDKPSAYKSGAVVRCRKGDIWKGLKEIGDSTSKKYPWKLVYKEGNINKPDGYAEYEFITDSDLIYGVQIHNINKFLDVDFVADGSYDETNKGEIFNVMATITDIIKNIVYKNQDILGIRYDPKNKLSDFGAKRDKLYRAYLLQNIPKIDFIKQGNTIFGILPKNINEDESLHKWFKRSGPKGKEGGWVDCNTCKDGSCKACGRKKGEKRSKYPSCRPTPAQCKTSGKGKKWGKTK